MRLLVTGAEGQVGSAVAALADARLDVRPYRRSALDITNGDAIKRRFDEAMPDVVVNCAAYTAVDRAEDEPERAHAVNATALGLLGDSCAERRIPIIHLSTDYVFDGRKPTPYVEDDPPNPLGVYGASKLAGEERLRNATERHIILRVSWVFGHLGRSFVDTIVRLARTRETLTVVDDQIGAPSPAAAIADAIRRVAESACATQTHWGTYHFSTTPALSWCAFARRIVATAEEYGLLRKAPEIQPIATADWPAKAARPLNSRLDSTKIARTFGCEDEPWDGHLREYIRVLQKSETTAPA